MTVARRARECRLEKEDRVARQLLPDKLSPGAMSAHGLPCNAANLPGVRGIFLLAHPATVMADEIEGGRHIPDKPFVRVLADN